MLGKNGPGRNAGEDHAGTQGWQGSCQVAMPGRASGDARLPPAGGEADFVGKKSLV